MCMFSHVCVSRYDLIVFLVVIVLLDNQASEKQTPGCFRGCGAQCEWFYHIDILGSHYSWALEVAVIKKASTGSHRQLWRNV